MPTYEYECQACGHTFELYQQITAKPVRICPACGKSALKRLIGAGAGLLFRGSGFYQTDYRSANYKKAAKGESKPAGTKESKDSKAGKSEGAQKGGAKTGGGDSDK